MPLHAEHITFLICAFFTYNGERYKILKATTGNGAGKIGEVISDNLEIVCGNNKSIKILEIQRQGKDVMSVSDLLRGFKFEKGENVNQSTH